VASCHS
jgi:AAA+ ATPase superfamily predicted ATPase